jgi:hypothetical protein
MQKKAFTGNTRCIFLIEMRLESACGEKSIVPGGKQAYTRPVCPAGLHKISIANLQSLAMDQLRNQEINY